MKGWAGVSEKVVCGVSSWVLFSSSVVFWSVAVLVLLFSCWMVFVFEVVLWFSWDALVSLVV